MRKLKGIWRNTSLIPNDVLLRSAPLWVHSINRKGMIINVSDSWAGALGYTPDEMIGFKSTSFLTNESRQRAIEEILPDFFELGYAEDIPYAFQRKDGSILNVSMSAIAITESGTFLRSLAFFTDNTNHVKINGFQVTIALLLAELKTLSPQDAKDRAIETLTALLK